MIAGTDHTANERFHRLIGRLIHQRNDALFCVYGSQLPVNDRLHDLL